VNPAARKAAAAIAAATGEAFTLLRAEDVGGGCIHTALSLTGRTPTGERRYFAKVNEAANAAMFEAEADGLAALGEAGALRVPATVAHGRDDEHAWLVLEWLDLLPLDGPSAAALGSALAAQHRRPCKRFGWRRDNFIGASPQENAEGDDWSAFWRDRRLAPQLGLAARHRLPSRMIDRGERLAADCGAFFRHLAVTPSLLHGDLWPGNAAGLRGAFAVFDPAVYAGHREADIAMTELFGGFPRDFQAAYFTDWPVEAGYTVRRDLYNLYHVLNHANLFAGGYVRQAADGIEKLLAEVG
jgi:fructosamine-3-kinase